MDWLIGCFGGAGRKARKHKVSQKLCAQVPQRSFEYLPIKRPPPSSFAINAVSATEEEKQSAGSTLAQKKEGILCKEVPKRTLEDQKNGDPWSQLDDLEEELEDLRHQIEKEKLDAKKIKEEVTFLRSCGTLLQTPSELKKKDGCLDTPQDVSSVKGWHSWLMPSSQNLLPQFTELSRHQSPAGHQEHAPKVKSQNSKEGYEERACVPMLGQDKPEVDRNNLHCQGDMAYQQSVGEILGYGKEEINAKSKPCDRNQMDEKPHVLKPCNDSAMLMGGNGPSHGKRLKIPVPIDSTEDAKEISPQFQNLTCTFIAAQGPLSQENANHGVKEIPQPSEQGYHTGERDNCESCMMPHSPSSSMSSGITDGPFERVNPCHEHCGTYDTSHSMDDGGGYIKGSSCDGQNDYHLDSTSCSSHYSEETLTDLSAQNSCVSLKTRSAHESIHGCEDKESLAADIPMEKTVYATPHGFSLTQQSVAQNRWRMTQSARYELEYDESKRDQSLGEATLRVCVECTRTSGYKQTVGFMTRFGKEEDRDTTMTTPYKISECITTPEFQRSPRARRRPPPVLTPIENALQWKQLKKKKHQPLKNGLESDEHRYNSMCDTRASHNYQAMCNTNDVKASTVRKVTGCTALEGGIQESWGENEHGVLMTHQAMDESDEQGDQQILDAEFAGHNMSLSHWLTPSPQQGRGCRFDSPTPLLRNPVIHYRTLLSDATTPAEFTRHGFLPSRDPDDRPILGIISGDNCSYSAVARTQWDGKGIPNTTTKYKEDQRVTWHASPFEVRLERALNKQGEAIPGS